MFTIPTYSRKLHRSFQLQQEFRIHRLSHRLRATTVRGDAALSECCVIFHVNSAFLHYSGIPFASLYSSTKETPLITKYRVINERNNKDEREDIMCNIIRQNM